MATWIKKPLQINKTPTKGLLGRLFDTLKLHHDRINSTKAGKGIYFNLLADGGIEICSSVRGGAGGGGNWSGIVWYLGKLLWDYKGVDYSRIEALIEGDWVEECGVKSYLKLKMSDGSVTFTDAYDEDDIDQYNYYAVAERSRTGTELDPYTYTLSNRTCGDIRLDMIPHTCGAE